MAQSTDPSGWRKATPTEVAAFLKGKSERKGPRGSLLVIRAKLTQADVYSYLRARFGVPNGFQNILRKDDSDNLVHWDFSLKAGAVDVYIQGRMRDIMVMVSEPMTDEDWKAFVLALRADFARAGAAKSRMLKSFEKFLVFQNKFAVLADECANLHAAIVDADEAVHEFLIEIQNLLQPKYREFFRHVIDDSYPGYEVKAKRVTKILPGYYAAMLFPNEKYDDELKVRW